MSEPLLTRKKYREALEREKHHNHESEEEREQESQYESKLETKLTRRPKLTRLQMFNRFLNVWLITAAIAIIVLILIQIFL